MKNFTGAFAFFLVLIACIFLSCAGSADEGLRYGFTTEPTSLDPLNPQNTADGRSILFNVFEGLVKPNTDGTFMPCVAQSWTISRNSLVYNFILRDGLLFSDGTNVTAEDVKYSLDTAIAAGFTGLNNIEEVQILNGNQISITLNSADPEFLPYLTTAVVKRDLTNIGTGPYVIENYTPLRNMVLTKNNNYWQSNLPHINKITISFFDNYDTLMVALRGGSIDGAFITGDMAAQLNHRDFDINNNRSAAVQLLALNNAFAPFEDIRVRRAINHGTNVQDIIDTAFFGQGNPSGSPLIPGLSVYYQSGLSYSYDPQLARSLLAEAGYNEANALSLTITVPSSYVMHVNTAQVIVNQLKEIGVNASIQLVDWNTWINEVYLGRNYHATIISLDSPIVSPRGFLGRYHSQDSDNFINFNNSNFDRVFDNALNETDSAKRIELYKEAQKIISENAASVYIQDILYFIVLRGGVFSGALDYPLYVIDFSSLYRVK
ncbi:MAG: ABC transporter substrate-binding protein [Treponema sp.]|nr:ABC transporter substrate-binding protein [Treponema sp.]MCL2237128.1 ABC transporter substrate-binding protein [Treponema sp.]